ncbi:septal ring lytic transglycosylase RlpA family protein [Cutibacterium modestum]|uniref:septal ring lytic transglycosylase RlpA family protein n=1 Tax=Cutibacterium modestum TaxID=2559073 RepID=UPI000F0691AD|nr:septal ring lytic transglycosylase RlpA family protein [Cutibacterium modestum]MCP2378865.1 hypothetical protein [Cutibacterium modestum 31N]
MIRPKRSVRGAAATIALTSGISVVAPAILGSVAHAANTQTMYATTDVNVRSASSNSGKVLTVAARGQSVKVTGKKARGWVPVAVNGTTGWIYERFLTEENVHPVHFGSEALPGTMTAAVPVNVRGDAANAGKILTVAERGQQVRVTGRPDRGWVPVAVNGKSGWIYGRYLTTGKVTTAPAKPKADAKNDSATSRDQDRPALDSAATRTTSGLNMRTAPSPSSQVINQLANGAGVQVTGEVHGNWVQIRADGHTGWAYRTYLTGKLPAVKPITPTKPAQPTKSNKPSTPAKDSAPIHTTTGVNVHTAPSPNARIITALTQGTGVHATGEVHGNWVQIRADGHTGWAYRTYLTGKVPATKVDTPSRNKHKGSDTSRDQARPPRQDSSNGDSDRGSGPIAGRCIASFYDEPQTTASGEEFDPNAMTAANRTLPLGTHIRVTNVRNGRSAVVRINDRGPYVAGRCIDLSRASFAMIADTSQGTTPITYTILD